MISSSILQNCNNNNTLKSNDILLKKYEIDVNKIKLPRNLKNKIESSLTCVDSEILSSDEDLKIDEESSIEHLIGDEDLSSKTTRHCVKFINRDGKIVKIFECGICNKNFTHQYTLMRHLPMHTNERNFICNDCGKAFRQLSTLSQHRAIHSVDRPFQCETCEKSFNRISTLISHRKTHSDEKPYRCHLCNKSFHQKGNLRNHIYIHTNERPYRCALCNKGFNQMSNLVCHAQKAHSAQLPDSWSCTHCSKRFQKRSLLRAHELETHHFQMPIKTISSTTLHKIKTPYSQKNTTFVLPTVSTTSSTSSSSSSSSSVTSTITTKSEISESAIVIPAIDTDAMKKTKKNHEIPFAILHFIEGQPLLVRVIDVGNGKSLLRPVNTEDFTMLRRQSEQQQQNPNKNSAEILMPIVAAIFQTLNSSGEPDFEVKSPKNIYKFPNLENLLNYEYNKNTQNQQQQQQQSAMAIGVKVQFNLNNSNNNNNSKNINNNLNNNNNINDNNQNQQINIKNEYQNFNEIKKDTTISWNGDLNDILSNTNNNNNNNNINENNNIEDQKAVAIVQDCNWWKKDDEKQNLSTMIEPKIENFIKNDQFLNLGTNNLLTPKRGDEQFELLPSLNLENNNLLSNSATGNMEDEEININLIRNFLTENRKFFADIDDLVAELFQQ